MAVFVPVALAVGWTTAHLPALPRLILCAVVTGATGAYLLYRWGIPQEVWGEILGRFRKSAA
jgi:hypothetical protein